MCIYVWWGHFAYSRSWHNIVNQLQWKELKSKKIKTQNTHYLQFLSILAYWNLILKHPYARIAIVLIRNSNSPDK